MRPSETTGVARERALENNDRIMCEDRPSDNARKQEQVTMRNDELVMTRETCDEFGIR